MIDLQTIFKGRRLEADKLTEYGFSLAGDRYVGEFPIMQEEFTLRVTVAADGAVDYLVRDAETAEEFFPARVADATGEFVGEVHAACGEILSDIARNCFRLEHFQNGQTKRILRYIEEKYGAEPEFLWKAYPDYAALRTRGKKLWFAFVGKVEKKKFGIPEGGIAEVLNLKNDPSVVASRIEKNLAYPAYHMNKRCWFSTFSDGSLPDGELFSLIDESFLAVEGKSANDNG